MAGSRIAEAVAPLLALLDEMQIRHFAGGSVASSIHGIARFTQDIDLVADLKEEQIETFAKTLSSQYYADVGQMRDALRYGRSFNLIHLETGFKIDIFPLSRDEFHIGEMARAETRTWNVDDKTAIKIPVSSPEDTILEKLACYKRGGEISDRQWSDVLGIAVSRRLDRQYLRAAAPELGVADLLERLFGESSQIA